MEEGRVYQRIKAVNISPLLAVLPALQFVAANIGSKNPAKSPCSVVPPGSALPPAVPEFVESLGLGGRTARILFRRLAPYQGMPSHVDAYLAQEADWRRFHVPLTSNPAIVMRWPDDGVSVHLEPGWLYEVRYDRRHEVVHPANCERIHLQVDQIGATI